MDPAPRALPAKVKAKATRKRKPAVKAPTPNRRLGADSIQLRVLAYIKGNPRTSAPEIGKVFDTKTGKARDYVKSLLRRGLIRFDGNKASGHVYVPFVLAYTAT